MFEKNDCSFTLKARRKWSHGLTALLRRGDPTTQLGVTKQSFYYSEVGLTIQIVIGVICIICNKIQGFYVGTSAELKILVILKLNTKLPVCFYLLPFGSLFLLCQNIFFSHSYIKTFLQSTSLAETSIGNIHFTFFIIWTFEIFLKRKKITYKFTYTCILSFRCTNPIRP